MAISKVGVVGGGLMGHGIAQICAQAGWDVVLREVDDETAAKAVGKIEKQLSRAVEKGRMEQSDADAVRARIDPTTDYGDLADCDLVIEAMTEDLDGKLEMWREVDGIVKEDAFFATNTSSLAVIDQAAATGRADRFLGLHFFNPAQVMPLLEVVQTVTTSDEALKTGFEVGEKLNKTVVHAKDKTGFIVNRLLVPYMLDAIRAYEEGVGSIEEIDKAMKAGANHPMGPLTLADFVGLDTLVSIGDVMFDEYRERRVRRAADPAQDGRRRLVRAQVRQGFLRLLRREAGAERARPLRRPATVRAGRGACAILSRMSHQRLRGPRHRPLRRPPAAAATTARRSTRTWSSWLTGSRPTRRRPRSPSTRSSGSASGPARS